MAMHEKIKFSKCDDVYEPAEDSFLLAMAVERYATGKVLDMGTGSGIQGIVAAVKGLDVTLSDIDENAISCARRNAKLNGVEERCKFVLSDMFAKITGKFDTIIFNPPYLASDSDPKKIKYISLEGGENGRMLIDRFIPEYKKFLNDGGIVLLLESSINNYFDDVKKLNAEIVGKEHYFFEDIVVLKFD